MRENWKDKTLYKLAEFFTKHSPTLKNDDTNLYMDAVIVSAGLYSLVIKMLSRDKYKFVHNDLVLVEERLRWVFRQLIILYRLHHIDFLAVQDNRKRFFEITPTGEVTIDKRVYNVPKYLDERGFYPSLFEGAWVKPIYPEKDINEQGTIRET